MTKRVWASVLAVLVLAGAVGVLAHGYQSPALRSKHAQPARIAVESAVFVSAEGNLFHEATCKDLHHPAVAMPANEAIAKGYAPCTRCMRRALEK